MSVQKPTHAELRELLAKVRSHIQMPEYALVLSGDGYGIREWASDCAVFLDALPRLLDEIDGLKRGLRGMAIIYKAVCLVSGDGWKDPCRESEVAFVYAKQKPKPYAEGLYPRVGCKGWSVATPQWLLQPASWLDFIRLIPTMLRDRKTP